LGHAIACISLLCDFCVAPTGTYAADAMITPKSIVEHSQHAYSKNTSSRSVAGAVHSSSTGVQQALWQ
jgi:hypothetical protein